jgi:hypothetical protein
MFCLRLRGHGPGEADADAMEGVSMQLKGASIHADARESPEWLQDLEAELKQQVDGSGKPLSKNEVKRRLKAAVKEREKLERQREKEAAGGGGSMGVKEDDLDPNQYFEHRCAALQDFKLRGGSLPYSYETTLSLPAYRAKYEGALASGEQDKTKTERLAGRILQKRVQGKLAFYELNGGGAKVQIMAGEENFVSAEEYKMLGDLLRRGDVVGVSGFPGVSQKGELSLFARTITLLAPCLRNIPKLNLIDPETRYRQRYLDLIINPQVRSSSTQPMHSTPTLPPPDTRSPPPHPLTPHPSFPPPPPSQVRPIFQTRSRVIQALRGYLLERDFLEVSLISPESGCGIGS